MFQVILIVCALNGGGCGPVLLPTQYAAEDTCRRSAAKTANANKQVKDYFCAGDNGAGS